MLVIVGDFSAFSSFSQADYFGKMVFIALFLLSIISWTVMISKILLFRKTRTNSLFFEKEFEIKKDFLLNFDLTSFALHQNPYFSIYYSLKQKTLEILNKNKYFSEDLTKEEVYLSRADIELLEAQVGAVISNETKSLEKNLFILSTSITLAPFLGLLGTVWGILLTFSGLQAGISNTNSIVLSGLAMALGTTVFGLIVAIPSLVGYNYIKSVLNNFYGDMELFSHSLMTTLEIQYRRVEEK